MSQYSIASLLTSSRPRPQNNHILLPSSEAQHSPCANTPLLPDDYQKTFRSSNSSNSTTLSNNFSEEMPGKSSSLGARKEKMDRYIPLRIEDSFHLSSFVESHKHNQPRKEEGSTFQAIYQWYVMKKEERETGKGIEVYKNRNRFKYAAIENKETKANLWKTGLSLRDELSEFQNKQRKIPTIPIKVLDAPALQDDYYLNLLDWSPDNYLAVGLATSAYLWNSSTCQVNKLCELGLRNFVTSVSCSPTQPILAMGTQSGVVQVWDATKMSRIRSFGGHSQRVGCLSWGNNLLSTGSRDNTILNRDMRCSLPYISRFQDHKQEVCGLKWSFDEQQLCSGGNDNRLLVWSKYSNAPLHKFQDHTSAVKAVAWSPHQHGLLASGGGTADRTIKFRNTMTGQTTGCWQTGSQVCNIVFSRTLNELVSTHGYSENEVAVWDCSSMKRLVSLKGHSYRVLYLAMSPDGSTVVTGAGDETLRFWQLFPSMYPSAANTSQLDGCSAVLR